MSLQGTISTQNEQIGWWKAVRVGEIDNERGNTYQCEVRMFPPCHPEHHGHLLFEVRHFYADGAAALASKILWQFALRNKKE